MSDEKAGEEETKIRGKEEQIDEREGMGETKRAGGSEDLMNSLCRIYSLYFAKLPVPEPSKNVSRQATSPSPVPP